MRVELNAKELAVPSSRVASKKENDEKELNDLLK
jgi:hypothetical protein